MHRKAGLDPSRAQHRRDGEGFAEPPLVQQVLLPLSPEGIPPRDAEAGPWAGHRTLHLSFVGFCSPLRSL